MKKHFLSLSLTLGMVSFWGINFLPEKYHYLYWIAGTIWGICFTLSVINIREDKSCSKKILLGIILLHLSAILSGPILEDDYYRYSWDGRNIRMGMHPYNQSPYEQVSGVKSKVEDYSFSELPLKKELEQFPDYTEKINYPMYRTVYPPLAELSFASEVLAPDTHYGWPIFLLIIDLLFIYYLVYKSKIPFISACLLLTNPLLLKEGLNSLHFDFLLVPLLILYIYYIGKCQPFILGLMCGLRPWFAALILWELKSWQVKDYAVFFATLALPWILLVLYPGFPEDGFSSWSAFVKSWEFNALFYEVLRQVFGLFTDNESFYRAAGWIIGFSIIFTAWKYKKDNKAYGFAALAAWLLFLPTVNPWYLMPIAAALAINENLKLKALGCALTTCLPMAYIHYEHFIPGTPAALSWALFELFAGLSVYLFVLKSSTKNLTDQQTCEVQI